MTISSVRPATDTPGPLPDLNTPDPDCQHDHMQGLSKHLRLWSWRSSCGSGHARAAGNKLSAPCNGVLSLQVLSHFLLLDLYKDKGRVTRIPRVQGRRDKNALEGTCLPLLLASAAFLAAAASSNSTNAVPLGCLVVGLMTSLQ